LNAAKVSPAEKGEVATICSTDATKLLGLRSADAIQFIAREADSARLEPYRKIIREKGAKTLRRETQQLDTLMFYVASAYQIQNEVHAAQRRKHGCNLSAGALSGRRR